MSITSSVGLISGINTGDIIDQLTELERRPIKNIERRNATLQAQTTAYQSINAQLLAMSNAVSAWTDDGTFRATTASSSNESVLAATSNNTAIPGNYAFTVKQLVSGQQTITRGFADRDASPFGATTLTFDSGKSRLDAKTELAQLNGGEGVERGRIRITDRAGNTAVVDLSTATTVDEVIEKINAAGSINVVASVDGDRFTLGDASGGTAVDLKVENVGNANTAGSLGLLGSSATGVLEGQQVNRVGLDTSLGRLNDGNGVEIRQNLDDFSIGVAGGATHNIDLSAAQTLGDVINTINDQTGGEVTASINAAGTGLELVDNTGTGGLTITELNSKAATDLGLAVGTTPAGDTMTGSRIVASMNSKLLRNLNGGEGVAAGAIDITNSAGATTAVDLANARSIDEVLKAINDSGAGVTAALNAAGNGLEITDHAGGAGDLTIADNGSTTAADLGLDQTSANGSINSGNLQYRYVTFNTRLDDLGVGSGKFTITDANGNNARIDLTQGEATIGEVIREINGLAAAQGAEVEARINDQGDGIELVDSSTGGTQGIRVTNDEGTAAQDLGIVGQAENPGEGLSGSFETAIEITADDTLEDVVQKINDAEIGVAAGIVNDGSAGNPFRLSLTSREAGTDAAFVFDDGGLGLNARNFAEARDAVAFFGSADPAQALAITSTSNRLDNVIPGVDLDLLSTSDQPVQVTISENTQAITDSVSGFTEAFNGLVDTLNQFDSYNQETEERGILLGDSAVARVRRSIYDAVLNPNNDLSGQYKALSQVGITVGSGAKLQFDQDKFLAAWQEDPKAVRELFTFEQFELDEEGEQVEDDNGDPIVVSQGIGVEIKKLIERLSGGSGPIQSQVDLLGDRVELNNQRIESLEEAVAEKRARLEREFSQMELALAQIQDQQSALSQLQSVSASQSSLSSLG